MTVPWRLTAAAFLIVILQSCLPAAEPLRPKRASRAPVIDGVLDDAVWQEALSVTGFRTYAPDYGKPMMGDSKVYLAYDDDNLYFAFRCYDSDPGKIKTSIANRDNIERDDWICINFDTFFDHQAGYGLYVNPFGIQGDTRFTTVNEDIGFDLVWYSAGRIDSAGYTVEVRLPLGSLRFADKDTVMMGVIFERSISRNAERGTFPPLDPAYNESYASWLKQMYPIAYAGLKHRTLLELLPALTYSRKDDIEGGSMRSTEDKSELSFTGKYGITADLILDGTYRPDFSQVESDAGQVDVNLRYNPFYSEKRPFFQEGRESFQLAGTGISDLDPVQLVVHTRTIVSPVAGAKLAGKIGEEGTLAALYAADELPPELSAAGGKYNHFAVLRYKQAFGKDSYLGGLYAGVEQTAHHNRLGALDGQIRLTSSSLVEYNAMISRTKADGASPEETGHTLGLRYSYGTREIDYDMSFRDIAENFQADMGYITRTGILEGTALVRPKIYLSSDILRRIDVVLFTGQTKDRPSGLWETYNYLSVLHYLWGSFVVRGSYYYSTEIFRGERFRTDGFRVASQDQWTKELFATASYSRAKAVYYEYDPAKSPYQGTSNNVALSVIYQPADKLSGQFSFIYSNFRRDRDWEGIYDYPITRFRCTYQMNQYLFLRGILQYNNRYKQLLSDGLVSFTYIPGTVVYGGYGSLYQKIAWDENKGNYVENPGFLEIKRGFFFKTSYLWRL